MNLLAGTLLVVIMALLVAYVTTKLVNRRDLEEVGSGCRWWPAEYYLLGGGRKVITRKEINEAFRGLAQMHSFRGWFPGYWRERSK